MRQLTTIVSIILVVITAGPAGVCRLHSFLWTIRPAVAWAEPENPGPGLMSPGKAPGKVDIAHKELSRRVTDFAGYLDSFFDDQAYEAEANTTRLKLRFNSFIEDGEGADFNTKIRLRLVLPGSKKRLHFSIAGDPDDEADVDNSLDDGIREDLEKENERSLSAGLRYFFTSTDRRNLSLRTGLRLRGGSPVLKIGPRYRETFSFAPWALRFTQTVDWFSGVGWETKSSFDLDRPLSDAFLFRATAEGSWFEDEDGFFYDLRMRLFQALTKRRVLQYEWNNYFETSPSHRLEETNFKVRYRQRIWREWLYFEVAPQVSFPRENDFNATPGILFRLEAFFGNLKDLK